MNFICVGSLQGNLANDKIPVASVVLLRKLSCEISYQAATYGG